MRKPSPESSLTGILVVSLEQAVAAPYCTARLAQSGARVIKVERASGDFARHYDGVVDGLSAYFVWLNGGKESVVLDLTRAEDALILTRMIALADVFVQNLAPGAAARLGFDSHELRARHPRLITCDISGYGDDGPWSEMKAYDLLIQCETGLASITGGVSEPGRVGVSVADISCGMNAHSAILQALYERERTGKGNGVGVSLFDSLAEWMAVPLLHHDYAGSAPPRVGLNHPSIAPYGAYRVMGGQEVVLAVQNDREWRSFCAVVLLRPALVDDPRFATNALRCGHRRALDMEIGAVVSRLSAEDLIARLKAAKVAFGKVNSVAGLSGHPQLRRSVVTAGATDVLIPASPWRWDGQGEPLAKACPALDEHGEALRREFAAG